MLVSIARVRKNPGSLAIQGSGVWRRRRDLNCR
nr:MAG TPA: hypothetical protein [Caudoviricetes sp.]